ncbi:NAD(P)-dependent oxidoreductase [bacterium]|nr:NAD(P)-dependent oxidoreductase [bacterium]
MFKSKDKILVVGGAGYVGSILVRELLDKGYAVKVVDRLFFGDQGIREVKDRIELVVEDIRNIDSSLLEDIQGIINISGLSNDPTAEYNPKANFEMNTLAAARLAKLAKEQGIKRHIFASSCSVYYVPIGIDTEDVILTEDDPIDPKAAYSKSKYEAEKLLLELADENFCPVILRKGTIYGFSPRMRYDLVVNTFLKSALSKGLLNLHYGGEMWRPLIDIHDVANVYILALEAPEDKVCGQIFNIVSKNYRVSELALKVYQILNDHGKEVKIQSDYRYKGIRSYRVSTEKAENVLGFKPKISLEESILNMLEQTEEYGYTDFDNPRYYNIVWMKLLEEIHEIVKGTESIFDVPKRKKNG